jgi:hypothetical protein
MPTVKLLLDDGGGGYSCGQEIKGRVRIITEERLPKAEATISLRWKGVGEAPNGNVTVVDDSETKSLTAGDWEPGASVYPFSLRTPVLGRTYRGKIMDIGWYVCAEVRVAGKTISSDGAAIQLAPPVGRQHEVSPRSEPVILGEPYKGMTGCLLASVAFLVGGIAIIWVFADSDAGFLGIVPGGFGLFGTVIVLRGFLVKSKLSNIEVQVGAKEVRAGSELPVSLKFQTRKPVEVQRVSVSLKAWEQVSATDSRRRGTVRVKKHSLFEQEWELFGVRARVQPGFPLTFAENVKVPAHVPASLELRGMRIVWQLEFRIVMPRSPDWWDTQPIIVLSAVHADAR